VSGPERVAFVLAMPMELRPLARRLSLRKEEIGGLRLHAGAVGGQPCVATVTGMGTALAAAATERLLEAVPVRHVVVVGISGAIDDAVPLGTLVVPEVVVDAASGAEHRPAPLGGTVPDGRLWTTDDLLTDPAVLARLRDAGVVALDMETAAVARVCEQRGVPWSAVRALSDRATDGSVDEEIFRLSRQDGTPDGRAIARYVARDPRRIAGMVRLAKGSTRAARVAADAAVRACASP
jgi:adenosylhomocysteine nucleosidase